VSLTRHLLHHSRVDLIESLLHHLRRKSVDVGYFEELFYFGCFGGVVGMCGEDGKQQSA
jgi:hypothetical protein